MFDFLSGIGDFLGGVADAVGAALNYILSAMLYLFNVLLGIASVQAQYSLLQTSAFGDFLQNLWTNFIKAAVLFLWDHLKNLLKWLADHIGRVIAWLQRLRTRLDQWYRMYIVPYLNMLQRIRQYLHILSLLHIKWAQELDQKIAQIQAQLVQTFATIRASLNAVIDIGNALVDPTYLLRKPQLLLSIRRQVPALIRVFTGKSPGYYFPSPKGTAGGAFAPWLPFAADGTPGLVPSASSLLGGDDGLGDLSGFFDGTQFTDGAVDQTTPLDYFNNDLYPDPGDGTLLRALGFNPDGSPVVTGS